jgi:capsid protein
MPTEPVQVTPGYRVIDRRGKMPWAGHSAPNRMIEGATPTTQRARIPQLDQDMHRNVSAMGRKQLLTLGRWLFWNFPAVSGAILEQAMLATENFKPQYYGESKRWGDKAEEYLLNWEKTADIAGWPYDMDYYRNNLVIHELRDGDVGTIMTRGEGGVPRIQVIAGHRIYNPTGEPFVRGGPFDGSRICDGVIIDDYRAPIAYRVVDEDGESFTDIPASNMFLSFTPKACDQVRGISALATAVFDWQDIKESRHYELIAQKAASAVALIEENEAGEADPADGIIKTAATFDSSGNKTALDTQEVAGGLYRYFKAGTNAKLQAFSYDRPGTSVQQYQETIIRDAFQGMEWSYFFSHDPSKIGGASMRVVVEKINRVIRKRQKMVSQAMARLHGWVISVAVLRGELPFNKDWWKWEYQLPPEITADKKYDSDVDLQEYEAKFTTLRDICARRGKYWEEVQDQYLLEQKRLQEKAEEMGVAVPGVAMPEDPESEDPEAETEDENEASKD